MIDYIDLRKSYIGAIQIGIRNNNVSYEYAKQGNEILHAFCEYCVDNSNYSEYEKQNMKNDLKTAKEILSQEIEQWFQRNN